MAVRGSYNDKNMLSKQVNFVNEILPCYNIKNLSDYESEVNVNSAIDLESINKRYEEIRSYFKVSGVILPVKNKRQAISLLKHLCIQARIPFDWDKTKDGYTFSIAPPNPYLTMIKEGPKFDTAVITSKINNIKYNSKYLSELDWIFTEDECFNYKPDVFDLFPEVKKRFITDCGAVRMTSSLDKMFASFKNNNANVCFNNYHSNMNNISFKLGDQCFRLVSIVDCLTDVILSFEVISKTPRKYGITTNIFTPPKVLSLEEINLDLPVHLFRPYPFYVIMEITQEEAEQDINIPCLIRYSSLMLNEVNLKKKNNSTIEDFFTELDEGSITYFPGKVVCMNSILSSALGTYEFDKPVDLVYPDGKVEPHTLSVVKKEHKQIMINSDTPVKISFKRKNSL